MEGDTKGEKLHEITAKIVKINPTKKQLVVDIDDNVLYHGDKPMTLRDLHIDFKKLCIGGETAQSSKSGAQNCKASNFPAVTGGAHGGNNDDNDNVSFGSTSGGVDFCE